MKTKHTPAPWKAFGPFKGVFVIEQINSDNDKAICETYEMPEAEANAHLIAAAPLLLDAAQSVLDSINQMTKDSTLEGCKMVLELAISKTKGNE